VSSNRLETYEVGSPWITYHYLTTDRQTRITGRSQILLACAICGHEELLTLRIPRIGPVPTPKGGRHEKRVEFVRAHQHTADERRDRRTWAKPLRNAVGLDLNTVADIVENAIRAPRKDAQDD
jgi:hypothetical protein